MYIRIGEDAYADLFPIIFLCVGIVGLGLAIASLIIGRKVKNGFRVLVIALSVICFMLFIGTLVNAIIGYLHPRVSSDTRFDYYHDVEVYVIVYAHHHACSWVCLGLASGAALTGALAFLTQLLTKNIKPKEKEEIQIKAIGVSDMEKDNSEVLFYQEYSGGAIEVRHDYIVIYKNWLPFTKFKYGRNSIIIFINDIQHLEYRGCGWFRGWFVFCFKHFNKPITVWFKKWFFWRRMAFNKHMTPVYEYIRSRVIENNK